MWNSGVKFFPWERVNETPAPQFSTSDKARQDRAGVQVKCRRPSWEVGEALLQGGREKAE